VVDSDDLPLNVSREILQRNKQIDTIRAASVKKVLGLLEGMARNDAEKYQKFWDEFGNVIKEGPAEDQANKERIAKLLRFASTQGDGEKQTVSLEEYVSRMKEGQDKIYYITADSFAAANNSPHLEVFRKKDIEVLLMGDRVDEWMMSFLDEFDGKPLQSIAKGELDLGELEDEQEKEEAKKSQEEHKDLLERMQQALGDKVKEVRVSHRLTRSPSCLVVEQHDMNLSMQKILKQAGQNVPTMKPILEINSEHPLVRQFENEQDEQRFSDWAHVLLDQATLSEDGQLDDPASFVSRLNELMLDLAGK
jgi:molecular chaperone HtpG